MVRATLHRCFPLPPLTLPPRTSNKLLKLFLTQSRIRQSPTKPDSKSARGVDFKEAISFLNAVVMSNKAHSIQHWNKVLAILVRNERYLDAIEMYRRLEFSSCVVSDIHTLTMLMNCYYCCDGCVGYGFGILGLILKMGFVPDVVHFTILIKGLFFDRKVEEAVLVLCRMEELGLRANEVTKCMFFKGLCNTGNWEAAVRWMEENGLDTYEGFQIYYSIIIDCLVREGFVEKAEEMMVEMRSKGLLPDLVTYNSFIYFWCNVIELDKAKSTFSEMKERGIFPYVVTYSMLSQAGRWKRLGLCLMR